MLHIWHGGVGEDVVRQVVPVFEVEVVAAVAEVEDFPLGEVAPVGGCAVVGAQGGVGVGFLGGVCGEEGAQV